MRAFLFLMAASPPALAVAQQTPPAAAPTPPAEESAQSDEPDIIVKGQRGLPGAVIGDIPPEQQLGPADIRSYGVSSVSDLLTELAPQTTSGVGGPPVVLLDGKRIAGFQEIRDIPTEAIARVDILAEEVALKYGYRADQKVVNIVLRRRFRATTAELADRTPTAGGSNAPQAELDLLHIRNGGRFNLHSEYKSSSALTESERDIAPPTSEDATPIVDQRPYRTLQAFTRNLSTNAVYARSFGGVSATVNGELESSESKGLNGLSTIGDPLDQDNRAITAHLGTTLNGVLGGGWNWSLTGKYDRVDSKTLTDVAAGGRNYGASLSNDADLDALVTGSPFALPAGPVTTSIHVSGETLDFSSRSTRAGVFQSGEVSRDRGNGQLNVDLPITSKSKGVLGAIGTLSLNGNLAVDQLSDFGTLTTYGYGANWSPVDGIRLIASVSDQDEAPTAQQLGNPVVTTPNVRLFDYVRGTTATVTTISGGNPLLVRDNRHVDKIGLTVKPIKDKDLTLTANYVRTRTDDPIASFPTPTAAIEAAFPDRFTRDAAGDLLRVDTRPINYARTESSQLRWGVNFSMPLKSKIQKQIEAFRAGTGPNPFAGLNFPGQRGQRDGQGGDPGGPPPTGQAAGTPPGGNSGAGPGSGPGGGRGGFGGSGFGGRGGGFGGRGGPGGGRLQFALYHTWHFTDRVLVADGGPSLDLLGGDAIGSSGGQPRHELEGQAGYTNNGLGARLSVNYASGTRVNGGTVANPEPLAFSGLATANLRLFGDLGGRLEWVKAHPFLRGTRVTFSIDNLFDSRQRVTDGTGATPISYQPDYLDPLGRTVRLSIRKLFF